MKNEFKPKKRDINDFYTFASAAHIRYRIQTKESFQCECALVKQQSHTELQKFTYGTARFMSN